MVNLRSRLVLCSLTLTIAAMACGQAVPPPVAVRPRSLEAEDFKVMRALIDDLLRPRLRATSERAEAPHLLVVGTTTAMCRRDPAELGPQPGPCLDSLHVNIFSELVPASVMPALRLRFPAWNAERLPISEPLGDDVTYVSETLLDIIASGDLLRTHPPGSDIVRLSAPGYPAPRMAVISFTITTASGAARIGRQADGRWRLAASVIRPRE